MIKPWPHSPFQIAKKVMNLGYNNQAECYEVYLDGALQYSGPTHDKAVDYCLSAQRKLGGRTSGAGREV